MAVLERSGLSVLTALGQHAESSDQEMLLAYRRLFGWSKLRRVVTLTTEDFSLTSLRRPLWMSKNDFCQWQGNQANSVYYLNYCLRLRFSLVACRLRTWQQRMHLPEVVLSGLEKTIANQVERSRRLCMPRIGVESVARILATHQVACERHSLAAWQVEPLVYKLPRFVPIGYALNDPTVLYELDLEMPIETS